MSDLAEYVEHFRARVLQDALNEATSRYWWDRAAAFDAARPRPDDFTGKATAEELAERSRSLADTALACRERAAISRFQTIEPGVLEAVREAA